MKKKVAILGVTGMLGHQMFKTFLSDSEIEAVGFLRGSIEDYKEYDLFSLHNACYDGIDILDMREKLLEDLIKSVRPNYIINCIGLTKPNVDENYPESTIRINSLLPHRLAKIAKDIDSKLIHISTDCIFTGKKGNYKPDDISDAEDLYGKSKYLGEVRYDKNLTIRTSIIGHELGRKGLFLEWLLSQSSRSIVKGFIDHKWSGVTTNFLSKYILELVKNDSDICGLIQLSGEVITKEKLVKIIKEIYNLDLKIESKETGKPCDRSLVNTSGHIVPSIRDMIKQMYEENEIDKKKKIYR